MTGCPPSQRAPPHFGAHGCAVPGADVTELHLDDPFRDVLDMDSLDFLSFVELLSERSGVRIEDEDTPRLATLAGSADFLVARTR